MSKGDQDNFVMFSCGVLCGAETNINISNCNITNCKIDIAYSNNTSSILILIIGGLFGIASANDNNKGKLKKSNNKLDEIYAIYINYICI